MNTFKFEYQRQGILFTIAVDRELLVKTKLPK
jgi:hypothetical protein